MVFFEGGFRPFFLGCGIFAVLAVAGWTGLFTGVFAFGTILPPSLWHGHEMIFGFAGAAVCGFMLTAVPNWTGGPPLRGAGLAALWGLWLAGRVVLLSPVPPPLAAAVDMALFPCLAPIVVKPIIKASRRANLLFPLVLLVLTVGNGLIYAEVLEYSRDTAATGLSLSFYALIVLVTLVSGRITPNFTANALARSGETIVPASTRATVFTMLSVVAAAGAGLAVPGSTISGGIAMVAACALAWRMKGWRFSKVLDQPIVWVLHLGHGWLAAGFALLGIADLTGWFAATTALHGLGIGAVGTMILAVMSRAALGHTGRPLAASRGVAVAYGLVSLSALVRIFGPSPQIAGGLWVLAFGLFVIAYWPILTRDR